MNIKETISKANKLRDSEGDPRNALNLILKYPLNGDEDPKDIIQYLLIKAVLYRDTGDPDSALRAYKDALEKVEPNDVIVQADIFRSMAFLSIHTKGLKVALELANRAVALLDGKKGKEYYQVKANCYAVLGNVLYILKKYEESLLNYKRSLDFAKKSHFYQRVITVSADISNVYITQRKYNEALKTLTKYTNLSKEKYRIALPQIHLRKAKIYFQLKDIDNAKESVNKAISISKREGWVRDLGEAYEMMGDICENDKSIEHYEKALEVYERGNFVELKNVVEEKLLNSRKSKKELSLS